ncbi:amino acid ABC transporter substrate-binding protein [Sinorhizobium sp. GL28]|uniref:amino acid ABC transporter substrate-binding protein n=1 Tax=Sinorhizobium sp. GL28 TaxID=1358418 RepID=UPI00071D97B3|nr:amino acid ABC transporter substrate-binding protein [Sinorhizobium sp. GL28]KSV87253.1 hypothetical protein N184_31390 [Sinorhizobium sp. GL28]
MSNQLLAANVTRRSLLKGASALSLAALPLPFYARQAGAADDVVHIGASLPLTGAYEKVSRICRDGYDFFTKVYDGKMLVAGKQRNIKLTIYDDENNASRAAQLTEKLISDDKVDIIVGTYGTDTILAQGAILQKYGKVFVQSGASSVRIDDELGGQTAFTANGRVGTYGVGAMNFLSSCTPKPATLALITMDDPVYHEIGQGVKDKCAEFGIEVVSEVVLPMNTQDLRPVALKLKGAGDVDIVYNTGWDVICIKLVQEMSALGINPKAFVGGHLTGNPAVREALAGKMEGIIGTTVWLPEFKYSDDKFASAADFASKFKETYGYVPTYQAAFSYICPWIFQEALKDADPADPFNSETLRKKLFALERQNSIWGPIAFDKVGRIKRDAAPAVQWFGNPAAQKIIAPAEMATAEGVYPKAAW